MNAGKSMKSKTTKIAIIFMVLVVGVVSFYGYLSTKQRQAAADAKMTAAQIALNRDLENDYPPTVKEVIKYYTDIQRL